MVNGGIFGPKLSGKTTLALRLSKEYWHKGQIRSMVLDPWASENSWGEHAWVTSDEDDFWQKVWASKSSLVIVDEASMTIRRERKLTRVFTALRHCHHKLIVIGHDGTDLLPVMRKQFDTLYLFRQPAASAKLWAETFANDDLLQAAQLQQYEFLFAEVYKQARRCKLKI